MSIYTLKAKFLVARLKNQLGFCYSNLLYFEKAQKYHEEALKLSNEVDESRRNNLGEEHEDTLSAMKEIAFTHTELGRVKKSLEHYEEALRILDVLRTKEWKYKDESQDLFEKILRWKRSKVKRRS